MTDKHTGGGGGGLSKKNKSFPYEDAEPEAYAAAMADLYTLTWRDGQPLGYMLAAVVDELVAVPAGIRGPVAVDRAARTVHAFEGDAEPDRTRAVAAVMGYWRRRGTFESLVRGWRDEPWPVYANADNDAADDDGRSPPRLVLLYSVERAGAGLLGVTRYGVHMMAYVRDESAAAAAEEGGLRIWVPRRAADKATYPGMLDNAAAGGLMTGEEPLECVAREADEEADLPPALTRAAARATGTATYMFVAAAARDVGAAGGPLGQIFPEVQWVFELELGAPPGPGGGGGGPRPRPKDGEVAGFALMTVAEVRAELARGAFKPNCALVVLDFLVRHRLLTPDDEPHLAEIVRRMHRRLPFPGPHQAAAAAPGSLG